MLRLALPKGRLWADSVRLMRQLGITVTPDDRQYVFRQPDFDLEVFALKIPDIPQVVAEGLVDLAVVSDEWLLERAATCVPMIPLCWYHVRICLLAPSGVTDLRTSVKRGVASPERVSVITPYVRLARTYLPEGRYQIRHVSGSAEAYPGRLADVAVDCVETGATLEHNGLAIVRTLVQADVRLVRAPTYDLNRPACARILAAIAGVADNIGCLYGASGTLQAAVT